MRHFKSPKHVGERRALLLRGGKRCFLKPKQMKYPVCELRSAKPTCLGALAARRRAILNRDHETAAKAARLGARLGCPWAKGGK